LPSTVQASLAKSSSRSRSRQPVERLDEAVGDELHAVGLEVDDVGPLSGGQRRGLGGEQRLLLVEDDIQLLAGILFGEDLLDLFEERADPLMVRKMAPHRQLVLSVGRRGSGTQSRGGGGGHHQ
jgi:hypothetical protein